MSNKKIILHNSEGVPYEFAILDEFEYKNNVYVVLIPTQIYIEQVTILQYEKNGDSDNYINVTDNSIINEVFKIFVERAKAVIEE